MTLKVPLQGFLDRSGAPKLSFMKGYVVDCSLSQLWNGKKLIHPNPLDVALAGTHLVKLRASRAGGAPAALKMIGGFKPVTITNPASGQSATVGPFYRSDYLALYAEGQALIAGYYDSAPNLREVVMAEMATVFDEPFVEPGVTAMPGFSLAAYEAAFAAMYRAHKAWKTTLQDLAFNPATVGGIAFTEAQITAVRAVFARQAVLGNNSLRDGDLGAQYDAMYAAIQRAKAPIYFQTAQLSKGVSAATFAKAVSYGANSVELPNGYSGIGLALLEQYQAKLVANPV